MSKKHKRTYDAIFQSPARSNIKWKDIESLITHLGGSISEGRGSRVRLVLNGVLGLFHRPHPGNETDKGAVKDMRDFLNNSEVSL